MSETRQPVAPPGPRDMDARDGRLGMRFVFGAGNFAELYVEKDGIYSLATVVSDEDLSSLRRLTTEADRFFSECKGS